MNRYRVLVAEDDSDIYEMLKYALEDVGCSVVRVSVASTALDIVDQEIFDAYIFDLGLIGGSALPALQHVAIRSDVDPTKIVVHTNLSQNAIERFSINSYCQNIVHKGMQSVEDICHIISTKKFPETHQVQGQ